MQRLSFVCRTPAVVLLCLAAALNLAGCARKNPEIPKVSVDRMQSIYTTYTRATEALGRGPKDLEEFKKFLPADQNIDDLLTSPHDGKPYKLVWNVNPRTPPKSMPPPLMAYEQEGKDGLYDIVTTMGVLRCNAEDLKKFIANTPGAGQ